MGMYRWAVYFLKEWDVPCDHVHGFNMDEWSDRDGDDPARRASRRVSERDASRRSTGRSGRAPCPNPQRWFATPDRLPHYAERIAELKAKGAELVVIFGIGRVCHIAFWEPHFAEEFAGLDEWKAQTHRLGARLHPLTIEQNALTSFKSRTTLVPAFANTIGPGLFLQADRIIGGADGVFDRGMQWQGASLWMTLRYGPDPWVPSSFMPTLPGRLFYPPGLAGPARARDELSGTGATKSWREGRGEVHLSCPGCSSPTVADDMPMSPGGSTTGSRATSGMGPSSSTSTPFPWASIFASASAMRSTSATCCWR